ncbi:MAG: hypothetical protein ABWY57_15920 [Mycetocola sp.]
MTLRLPDDIHERLRQQAFDQRTSITALIIERLAAGVADTVPDREVLGGMLEHSIAEWDFQMRNPDQGPRPGPLADVLADAVLALLMGGEKP